MAFAAALPAAWAADQTLAAAVQVLEPLVISENAPMRFGRIVAPDNGSANVYSTNNFPPSGAGNGQRVSNGNPGSMRVSGTQGEFISLLSSAGSCSDAGNLTLEITTADFPSTRLNGSFLTRGLFARLTVQSGTPAGDYSCDYTFTSNYQ